ncbi:DUF3990 domain-containing protein [Psychrobacillus sp. NPDC058041]|uniref:DUF3990 domain-containing protein n=1 Tax=Psychrobacillus sp. NPDC058041 TaxID=3346310 RepID=UPI0036DA6CB7
MEILKKTNEEILAEISENVLYHGTCVSNDTDFSFEQIDVTKGAKKTDFGKGFYMTTNKEMAVDRAESRKSFYLEQLIAHYGSINDIPEKEFPRAVVKSFKFDASNLSEIKYLVFSQYNEEWLNFIAHKKQLFNNQISYSQFTCRHKDEIYDVIYGPLVDGKPKLKYLVKRYTKQGGIINKEKLLSEISSSFNFPLQDQISIHTEKGKLFLKE